jgi:hypothetical protein
MKTWLEIDELYPLYSLWSEQPTLAGKELIELDVEVSVMQEYVQVMDAFYKMQRKLKTLGE